ncbi:monovalent cation/H+ antiporter subunit F [Shinella sp. SUS2]|jgi:multicomponent K+:H+ antiporter subunit F|uniref:K+/H+ antiporter subunit F n=1 Tax=unclassified Shinella TaxID=2643062 RepID=UPI000680188B|nr:MULTISPECIES: K+/H+ antiporter subunit F [unclassified Shinella]KNY15572.1 monovalent cation/H+ antiporter subunit F [Shinella sp. SUS2]KOC76114.1 cation:proton antiporter [Shinella sp. GWS1]
MSHTILIWSVTIAQVFLAIAMALAAFRMFRGPRAQDRVLALDTLYLNSMLLLMVFGIRTGKDIYFEASLVIGMLGFVATVALAKFLMRGEVIE